MERTMISWNGPNWITIGLMGLSTWLVVAVLAQAFQRAGLIQGAPPAGGGY